MGNANLTTKRHADQVKRWPASGRHILAQWNAETIVVYQAYKPSIGHFAAEHGYFGGDYRFNRMSWVKPNFLWMMYRSGWGTKPGQEVTLAIRVKRSYFDGVLAQAVASTFTASGFATEADWKQAMSASAVRLQWDPDHGPKGQRLERRAIQLGLRGSVQRTLGEDGDVIVGIEDISTFVEEQRRVLDVDPTELQTPQEHPYPVANPKTAARLRLDALP